jgi:hypothetical protein
MDEKSHTFFTQNTSRNCENKKGEKWVCFFSSLKTAISTADSRKKNVFLIPKQHATLLIFGHKNWLPEHTLTSTNTIGNGRKWTKKAILFLPKTRVEIAKIRMVKNGYVFFRLLKLQFLLLIRVKKTSF